MEKHRENVRKYRTQTSKPGIAEVPYTGEDFKVTESMKEIFKKDGALKVKGLLDQSEVSLLLKALEGSPILDRAVDLADGEGRASRMLLWNQPGSDITGMVARCEKMVNISEELLGGEVFHYHTKLMMKEARFGGKHQWHQDYGYWYKNGILKPDLLTVFIPLDKCVKQNGCLQVVPGSHRCGRIEHNLIAGQTMANPERVEWILQQEEFPLIFAEMEPGDALFFHCNVLHRSGNNDSDMRRWAFLVAYNKADNDAMVDHHHARYTPLEKVPNNAIKTCTNFRDFQGKDFLDPYKSKTIRPTPVAKQQS